MRPNWYCLRKSQNRYQIYSSNHGWKKKNDNVGSVVISLGLDEFLCKHEKEKAFNGKDRKSPEAKLAGFERLQIYLDRELFILHRALMIRVRLFMILIVKIVHNDMIIYITILQA